MVRFGRGLSIDHSETTFLLLRLLVLIVQLLPRRNEKKLLNDAHKVIKYKLEGAAPSKIRVQTPDQKAFVVLQCAIGQHHLNDNTLRQEMSFMVDFATRMLSAAEDYSVDGSRNGAVALESLLLRRNLVTSLWSESDGVLNQLRGVGHKTTAMLTMNKIRTFADVLSQPSHTIEQACCRSQPFGQELKAVVKKILQNTLSLSAHIENMDDDGKPNEVVCKLDERCLSSDVPLPEHERSAGIVSYTLCVHTDRPGGSLMFRRNVSTPGEHRIPCPSKLGRLYIRLVSNLIGLDEQLQLEGNDVVTKSSFDLSPVRAKSAKEGGKRKADKSKERTAAQPQSHKKLNNMVEGVADFRLRKKTGSSESNGECIKRFTSTPRFSAQSKRHRSGQKGNATGKSHSAVTPSPPPNSAYKSTSSAPNTSQNMPSHVSPYRERNSNQARRRKEFGKLQPSWKLEQREQKNMQQRAFTSPKENPL
uniref:SEC63 domain-containing protein n=2 Tax=Odontella aurita TaxID=265563 RepID=A0A6U6FWX7_9STRA|mmetsp:Transcript_35993/g.107597  ORF Transcript_35993/g.107597 Transcript_35993/m.107597 type:complete len:475 (+) Transcript_35993:933-2357(+)